ncbi:hypothetical protein HPB50_014547 [Hyalomma asiaticum]|uniref:Uncharacterized protein n=1 Tax=Hyalomma asiaticum TaxID=266040 RepID=A0ACB7RJZ7_HYAAI|nr:hypothetical protein HPB50_014547 [Hyalomma asiaticum]
MQSQSSAGDLSLSPLQHSLVAWDKQIVALQKVSEHHHRAFYQGERAVARAPPSPCRAERIPRPGPAERLIIIVTRHPSLASDS